jgi:hypothetical protein
VYLGSTIVDLFRRGLETQAVDEFLRFNRRGLEARRVLGTLFDQVPSDFAARAMEAEIESLSCNDPGMKPYVFLMLNDQRRHLYRHFELIDIHRTELHLPLFDSEILELMLGLQIEEGLYHKFYYEMLRHFPPIVRTVPWQAYPGHLPCPLQVPAELLDQWQFSRKNRKRESRRSTAGTGLMLRNGSVPRSILDKKQIYFASVVTKLGVFDRSYLSRGAATVYRHWRICEMSMPIVGN